MVLWRGVLSTLWILEISGASHGEQTYPPGTGMEIGLCSGSKSLSLSKGSAVGLMWYQTSRTVV